MFADNHGSDNANSPQLVNTVQPRVVVFQNGTHEGRGSTEHFNRASLPTYPRRLAGSFSEQHPEVNAPPANIANLSGRGDVRYSLQIAVDRNGDLALTNPRTGTTTRY